MIPFSFFFFSISLYFILLSFLYFIFSSLISYYFSLLIQPRVAGSLPSPFAGQKPALRPRASSRPQVVAAPPHRPCRRGDPWRPSSPRPSPPRPATMAVFSAPGGRLRPRPSSSGAPTPTPGANPPRTHTSGRSRAKLDFLAPTNGAGM